MLQYINCQKHEINFLKNQLTFASKSIPILRDPPFLLLEAWTASRALRPAGVMLTSTDQDIAVGLRVSRIASVRVTITHTPTAYTDILYTVVVLKKKHLLFNKCVKLGYKVNSIQFIKDARRLFRSNKIKCKNRK